MLATIIGLFLVCILVSFVICEETLDKLNGKKKEEVYRYF